MINFLDPFIGLEKIANSSSGQRWTSGGGGAAGVGGRGQLLRRRRRRREREREGVGERTSVAC